MFIFILLVDECPLAKEVLSIGLQTSEHDFEVVDNADQAFDIFSRREPHVIITAWALYPTSGADFIRQIRKVEFTSYPYVLVLTANRDKQTYLDAVHSGADDLIRKPLNTAELRHRLLVAERILQIQEQITTFGKDATICPSCSSISTPDNPDLPPERYIAQYADTNFSHGVCPPCAKEHFGLTIPVK